MRDKVSIKLDGKELDYFLSYSIASDIFVAGSEFSFTLPAGLVDPNEGDQIKVFVNDDLELSGVIDAVEEDDAKDGRSLTISGRDVLGRAVDEYVREFKSFNGQTLEAIVKKLFSPIEILNRSSIFFESESARFNVSKKFAKPDIGQTVLDFISRISTSKRLLFFANPDGTIVFAKIPTESTEDFKIYRAAKGEFRNVIRATRRRDITSAYSEARLYSQTNGGGNTKSTYSRDDFPFEKIFVGTFNEDEGSAEEQARAIIENQRKDAFSLEYIVPGHSQNGKNWRVRKGVKVEDERFDISKTFLLSRRVMEKPSKESGQITRLKLIEFASR